MLQLTKRPRKRSGWQVWRNLVVLKLSTVKEWTKRDEADVGYHPVILHPSHLVSHSSRRTKVELKDVIIVEPQYPSRRHCGIGAVGSRGAACLSETHSPEACLAILGGAAMSRFGITLDAFSDPDDLHRYGTSRQLKLILKIGQHMHLQCSIRMHFRSRGGRNTGREWAMVF